MGGGVSAVSAISVLSAQVLRQTVSLALFAFFHPLALLFVFGDEAWYFDRLALLIQGHIDQVSHVGVGAFARNWVFGGYLHLSLHRSLTHKTHFCLDCHQIRGANGLVKHQLGNCYGYHALL